MLRAPTNALTVRTDRCVLEVWQAGPGVVIQRTNGHASIEISHGITTHLDRLIAQGVRPIIFNDWEQLDGYTSDARVAMTTWTSANVKSLDGIHILLRSKLVAMGVAVANLAIRGVTTSYSDRDAFEQVIAQAIRQRSRAM